MSAPFQRVPMSRPGRSAFDLSHDVKLTCDMGQLIPILCEEVVPGDVWQIGAELVIRFQPLVAPVLHEVNAFLHYYFVPYRLLWDEWEIFITGDVQGDNASVLPTWAPTDGVTNIKGTLWDYFGFPVDIAPDALYRPLAFPRRAYNLVYNEYYRDQTEIAEVSLDQEEVLLRCWEKDYFTSCLAFQQRGTTPALPVGGTTSAVWAGNITNQALSWPAAGSSATAITHDTGTFVPGNATSKSALEQGKATVTKAALDANVVDLSAATTFDVADLRVALALQRWMERNARAGVRYTEFLRAHFGVAPRDERLQRPEYIGGMRSPVIVSEVLQTGATPKAGAVETETPQGNMAGHGLVADRGSCARFRADEFGVVIGILSVMPRPAYQQGIDRQWLRRSRYDFYFPEFARLSEQPVTRGEIYLNEVANDNATVFGYVGRYDEMRVKHSKVCGEMRDTFDYWHLGRQFAAAPELNQTFLECDGTTGRLKEIYAVQDEPGLLVNIRNVIRAVRPLPVASDPGM